MNTVLLDIGNTRIKWAALSRNGLGSQQADVYAGWGREDFSTRIFESHVSATRVLVSNVGGSNVAALLRDACQRTLGIDPEFLSSTATAAGVINAYSEPHKLGVDRWMALIAVYDESRAPACVVNVGTAMTVDAIEQEGRHLGGLILPGPDLMVKTLLQNTSDLAQRAAEGNVDDGIFADNTLGGIQQGAVHALASLVDRAFASMSLQVQGEPALLMTGGASHRIENLLSKKPIVIPDLVLRGLAVMARAQGPS